MFIKFEIILTLFNYYLRLDYLRLYSNNFRSCVGWELY